MPISSSSDDGFGSFSLLNGDTSASPDYVASFRIGDNRADANGWHEYMIAEGRRDGLARAHGHLVWDPTYVGPGSSLFSVAPVRLDVSCDQIRWAVGTNDFITCKSTPFRRIEKIQVAASADKAAHNRVVQWDLIDMTCHFADGGSDRYVSPCLPRVTSNQPTRRARSGGESPASRILQQYAEISFKGVAVSRIQLRGQVTLRIDHPEEDTTRLGADELLGRILVFTNSI